MIESDRKELSCLSATVTSPVCRAGSIRRSPTPYAAADFYGGLFGWESEDAMPAGAPARYLIARLRGGDVAAVSSQREGAPPQAVWNTYIWVEDADEAVVKAREAGGSVRSEPLEVMDAGWRCSADLEGAGFCVWQARERKVPSPTAREGGAYSPRDRSSRSR